MLFGEIFSGFKKFANTNQKKEFEVFKEKNKYWLEDYSCFLALKEHFGGIARGDFPKYKTKVKTIVANANSAKK